MPACDPLPRQSERERPSKEKILQHVRVAAVQRAADDTRPVAVCLEFEQAEPPEVGRPIGQISIQVAFAGRFTLRVAVEREVVVRAVNECHVTERRRLTAWRREIERPVAGDMDAIDAITMSSERRGRADALPHEVGGAPNLSIASLTS